MESPPLDQIISLLKSTSSTSSLDPLPLQILKQITNTVATPLHKIICGSLSSGSFPPDFKKAVITPIIKKPHLDSLSPSNYRPISNLSIHSKILERVISSQLITYLTTNKIPNIFQSAYLPHKSTESALRLITSDLLSGLNNNRGTILVLLDMSSAFDTLDHNFLIHRLSAIGITGISFNWFTSYITNCSSSVRINTHSSPSRSITHGVPQGSVLGPLLFNIYLFPMFDIFTDYPDISFHTYADDLQLYLNCTDSPTYAPDRLSSCIKSIHHWLTSNSLKLNPTKTEAIFLHLPLRSSTLPEPPPISLDNTSLPYSQHIRNLGFHLDSTLSLDSHLIHMHKSIHYHLHCLRLIRRSIPLPIAITITFSYIIPLFDYCNSLLFNLPEYKLIKLQRLQNDVVRCVHLLPRLFLTPLHLS